LQQLIGWDCCIQGFLLTEWLAVSRLMNLKKPDAEIIGWIIIMLWKHGTKPGKLETRNSKNKTDILFKPLTCNV
jgi:hypothetical protein